MHKLQYSGTLQKTKAAQNIKSSTLKMISPTAYMLCFYNFFVHLNETTDYVT